MAGLGWSANYLSGLKPPACDDPSTLALVGYQLARLLGPMPPPELIRIKTLRGGRLAIRFICSADFAHPDRIRLANGTVVQSIHFTSTLHGANHIQQVNVRLQPVVQWEKVQ